MVNTTCFVPGCDSGYVKKRKENKLAGKRNPSLFLPPKDEQLFEKWKRIIPRKDKILSSKDLICELHFEEGCIETDYITKMPDGTLHKIPKRHDLKPGSVPTIFPNLPSYLSVQTNKRKAPTPRPCFSEKKLRKLDNEESAELDIPQQSNDFFNLSIEAKNVSTPNSWWSVACTEDYVIFAKWNSKFCSERRVVICKDLSTKIFLRKVEVSLSIEGCTMENISKLLQKVDDFNICENADSETSSGCFGFIEGKRKILCSACYKSKKKEVDAQRRRNAKVLVSKKRKIVCQVRNFKRSNRRLKKRILDLKSELVEAKYQCSQAKEEVILEAIANLPSEQQTAIKTCFAASKVKSSSGIRYSRQWIYECLLLRIKSRKAYEHLRNHKILALPAVNTLAKYIRSVKGVYGFVERTFKCLKKKASSMPVSDLRGCLLIDEMKLSEALSFDKKSLVLKGFTDLGKYTPEHQKGKKGDHALVFMFQPFRGRWVQSLACFLSKGAASGTVLHHLIIECTLLMEDSGFLVDGIITDGATWNRNMWSHFGIDADHVSCSHIADEKRKLWFFSDFPHLIKNVRNFISSQKLLMTHEGLINTKFWEAVLEMDNPKGFNLKACPNLNWDCIYPQNLQKMNVRRAFQFFSSSVAAAMELYREDHLALENSEPCINFIRTMATGIEAMNSRTPVTSLKVGSSEEQAILDLLKYFDDWEKFALKKDYKFLSDSTSLGLKVTLKSTLEILHFLSEECNYDYLMTARLNQDALERFFGMIRHSAGCNDHPDPQTFLQLFGLMSVYSLVKPPKGSNVEGGEMVSILINCNEQAETDDDKVSHWNNFLDKINDDGKQEEISEVITQFEEHDYIMITSSEFVLNYISGYVVRRVSRFSNCDNCKTSLVCHDAIPSEADKLISLKSKGHLIYPSLDVTKLIETLERAVLKCLKFQSLRENLFLDILNEISNGPLIPFVGCSLHKNHLTQSLINFFLVNRLNFICTQENRNSVQSNIVKKLRKQSKL